jgi:hypothetical protein
MTRGKLVIVTPNEAFVTREYNGDMYMNQGESGPNVPISPGDIARKRIDEVNDKESFEKMIREFTKYYYGPEYANIKMTEEELEIECSIRKFDSSVFNEETNTITFANYFKHWFSDFVYMKNATGRALNVTTRDGNNITLEPNQSEAFYFGKVWTKDENNE